MKALEGKNVDLLKKNTELTKQNSELLEENTELTKLNDELLEHKATLTEELLESRGALKKSNEDKEKFRESAKLNHQQSKQLELDLIASRNETEELERRIASPYVVEFLKGKRRSSFSSRLYDMKRNFLALSVVKFH
ncbi:peroxisomal and mitochondrial division factor 1-like [Humulus lupulus]|uniref:peroxisomal and mitochondrial division factor 1-like n=1 Tax=Humulus lupulus TaxID=3486 RepID=UPI002B400E2B|nr:peroxisomal and mitochondrial division factor 1-like [Humulus lupulus]